MPLGRLIELLGAMTWVCHIQETSLSGRIHVSDCSKIYRTEDRSPLTLSVRLQLLGHTVHAQVIGIDLHRA